MRISIIIFLLSATAMLSGQSLNSFSPSGKPVFLIFSNVHSSFNKEASNAAFELTRLYLGYEYSFSRRWSAKANIDMGDPRSGDFQMSVYVKNAFMQYSTGNFSGRIGMIGTNAYSLIEKQWGYRYIFKTLQDEYSFNPSADLGAAAEYTPSKIISFDASVLNGEGYKKLQSDSAFKYSLGITLRPSEGMLLRAYTDFMKKDYLQNTFSLFAGYSRKGFKTGLEYDVQKNNRMLDGHDLSGVSFWASLAFQEKFTAFARYDKLWSATPGGYTDPWNQGRDGQMFLAGIDYSPVEGIKLAPVYTGWIPSDAAKKYTSTIGFWIEIKL